MLQTRLNDVPSDHASMCRAVPNGYIQAWDKKPSSGCHGLPDIFIRALWLLSVFCRPSVGTVDCTGSHNAVHSQTVSMKFHTSKHLVDCCMKWAGLSDCFWSCQMQPPNSEWWGSVQNTLTPVKPPNHRRDAFYLQKMNGRVWQLSSCWISDEGAVLSHCCWVKTNVFSFSISSRWVIFNVPNTGIMIKNLTSCRKSNFINWISKNKHRTHKPGYLLDVQGVQVLKSQ